MPQNARREPSQHPRAAAHPVSKSEFESIATFRYALRKFVRMSEQAARRARITPQQHALLLAVIGFPHRDYATVSELADRMQMRQHSMVGLIDRTESQGLVRREHGTTDRRQVFIHVTSEGVALLHRLAGEHRHELLTMRDALRLPE
ncbi:MAG TPA: MarR family transcriptional regulator [Ktedonobacterales bacterium]|nr:MarR family transcriptional regulator [Ktedonobacterales bacterium]